MFITFYTNVFFYLKKNTSKLIAKFLKSEGNFLLLYHALRWRKLISCVCQAAMRALQATGSCYHSQVQHADKLMMTANPGQTLGFYCVHMKTCICMRVSPACRQRFVNDCRDCRHTWDSFRFPTTRQEVYKTKREALRQKHPLCSECRCNISQDKASSV